MLLLFVWEISVTGRATAESKRQVGTCRCRAATTLHRHHSPSHWRVSCRPSYSNSLLLLWCCSAASELPIVRSDKSTATHSRQRVATVTIPIVVCLRSDQLVILAALLHDDGDLAVYECVLAAGFVKGGGWAILLHLGFVRSVEFCIIVSTRTGRSRSR